MSWEFVAKLFACVIVLALAAVLGALIWQGLHQTCSQVCVPR